MRQQASFVGWDFVGDGSGVQDHWQMCLDGIDYPRLAWQFSISGDFIQPGRVDNYDLYVLANDWLSVSSRCGDIAPPNSPDGIVNLLDWAEFSRHWLEVSLFGASEIDHLPTGWILPQLVLAWNANPRILAPNVTADKLTMYYSCYYEGQWQILQTHRDSLQEPFGNIQALQLTDGSLFDGHAPFVTPDEQEIYFYSEWMGVGEGICVSYYRP